MSNNELITRDEKLPATTEELQKFIVVGNDVIKSDEAKLKAIKDAGFAQEVYLQHLKQAQEKARTVIEAVIRCGELLGEPYSTRTFSEGNVGDKTPPKQGKSLPENITAKLAHCYRTIYQNRDRVREIFEDVINEANEKLPYWRSIFKKLQEKKGIEIPDLPEGVFNVIYIDPPWKYDFSSLLNDSTETSQHRISMYEKIRDYQDTNKKTDNRFIC